MRDQGVEMLLAAVEGSLARARALQARGLLLMAALEAQDAAAAAVRLGNELARRAHLAHQGARA